MPNPNRFLTNTYSKYVPTVVGDTIEEQRQLGLALASNYKQGRQGYEDRLDAFELLKSDPGNKAALEDAIEQYRTGYKDKIEQGNFEDNVFGSSDLTRKIIKDRNIKGIVEDRAKYEADQKMIDESETTQDFKDEMTASIAEGNPNTKVDENGLPVYNKYTPVRELKYIDGQESITERMQGYIKDGLFERGDDGQLIVRGDLAPWGYGYITKGTGINREELEGFISATYALDAEQMDSFRTEGAIQYNKLKRSKKGEPITQEELTDLFKRNSFYVETTLEEFLIKRLKEVDDYVEAKRAETKKLGKIFNEQQAIERKTKEILVKDILLNNVETAVNKYDGTQEIIDKFKTETGGDTNEGLGGILDPSAYNPYTAHQGDDETELQAIEKSDAFVKTTKEEITVLTNERVNLRKKQQKAIDNSVDGKADVILSSQIDDIDKQIEDKGKKIDFIERRTDRTAVQIYKMVTGGNEDGLNKMIDDTYAHYSRGKKVTGFLTTVAKNILPVSRIGTIKGISTSGLKVNPEDFALSKEEYRILIKKQMVEHSADDDFFLPNNELTDNLRKFSRNIKESRDKIGAAIYNTQYKAHKLQISEGNAKARNLYSYPRNLEEGLREQILADPNSVTSLVTGEPLGTILENNFVDRKDVVFSLSSTPDRDGNLTGFVRFPIRDKRNARVIGKEMLVPFSYDGANPNTELAKSFVKADAKFIENNFLSRYDSLTPDKKDYVFASNVMMNTVDGTRKRFQFLNLRSADKGEKFIFPIANTVVEFLTYGEDPTKNKILIARQDGYGTTFENKDVTTRGDVALGYDVNTDIENGTPRIRKDGSEVQPRWFLINNEEGERLFTVDEETGDLRSDRFLPADYKTPENTLDMTTFILSRERGTLNKSKPVEMTKHPNVRGYIQDNLDDTGENNTQREKELSVFYTPEKGYTPLSSVMGATSVSNSVNEPFVSLNDEGFNRLLSLFNEIKGVTNSRGVIATGGGRDDFNVVEEGSLTSWHKKYLAIDVLRNDAAQVLMELFKRNPEKDYIIKSILTRNPKTGKEYEGHIHVVLNDLYKNKDWQEITSRTAALQGGLAEAE